MADVSKIKLPSGTTYNIKDIISGYTTNTGTITKVQTTAGAHTTINVSSGAATFSVPTKTSHLTNDAGYLTSYTETDPVFSASAAAGITSTDIDSWNAKVSDDKTWNGVTLSNGLTHTGADQYIPVKTTNALSGTASQTVATVTPTLYRIAKYDGDAYLNSTTPSAGDNSTKVATTAYVNAAIPTKTSDLTNDSGFMTEAIMIVTLTESGGTLTSDKTYTEIVNAISNGEMVYISYEAYLYAYDGENGGSYFFSSKVIESSKATQTDLTLNSSSGGGTSWSKSTTTFTDSDQKLLCNAAVSGTTYYPVLSASRATASTKLFDTTGIAYKGTNGTTSAVGSAELTLGNNKANGTANNKQGRLVVYGSTAYAHTIQGAPTAARTLTLPDKAGTVALTSDIPTVPTISLNGSSTTSASFYAPTSAGTSGYVLTSAGSGAPSWTSGSLTDEKVKSEYISTNTSTTYLLTGSSSNTTTTDTLLKGPAYLTYSPIDATHNSISLTIGASSCRGLISLYNEENTSGNTTTIHPSSAASNVSITLPSSTGTLALKSEIINTRQTPTSGGTTLSVVNTGDMYTWNNKQAALVSGTNIKTINSNSLLGSGNVSVGTVTSVRVQASGPITSSTSTAQSSTLNTTIGFSKPYVTEQNTGNGWTYRIWSNNTMEMWTTVTITAATNTSDAGGYKSASSATPQNFPIAFADVPVVQVTCDSGDVTGSVTSAGRPTTTSAGGWRLYRHNSNTNTSNKNFMFYVIGTKAS